MGPFVQLHFREGLHLTVAISPNLDSGSPGQKVGKRNEG